MDGGDGGGSIWVDSLKPTTTIKTKNSDCADMAATYTNNGVSMSNIHFSSEITVSTPLRLSTKNYTETKETGDKAAKIKRTNKAKLSLYLKTRSEHAGIFDVSSRSCVLKFSKVTVETMRSSIPMIHRRPRKDFRRARTLPQYYKRTVIHPQNSTQCKHYQNNQDYYQRSAMRNKTTTTTNNHRYISDSAKNTLAG